MTRQAPEKRPATRPSPAWVCDTRGSALILTLLILLVLTGMGMTAMHSVGRSLHQSGAYRVRTQATGLANAAVVYTAAQVGRHAKHYWLQMNQNQATDLSQVTGLDPMKRGMFLKLTQDPAISGAAPFPELAHTVETGLLTGTSGGVKSFEADIAENTPATRFSVIIRDPIDGPAAPRFGQDFCFKKVTIASRALVGQPAQSWDGSGMVGSRRAVIETYIGPIDCAN